ncbi:MAG TPA: hypothetical protein ENH25_05570 [candidate division Zixibacteria bacterium]|nr:hypothetical protein [candidate division Zixibacteria bacterium]
MEIGFSNEQLIDVGLNAAGFILAGMLMMLIRSFFSGKKATKVTAAPVAGAAGAAVETGGNDKPKSGADGPEYVSLKKSVDPPLQKGGDTGIKQDLKMRNRQEIIRIAKKMLAGGDDAGAAASLPITDGELSMIKQRLNLQGAGRSE